MRHEYGMLVAKSLREYGKIKGIIETETPTCVFKQTFNDKTIHWKHKQGSHQAPFRMSLVSIIKFIDRFLSKYCKKLLLISSIAYYANTIFEFSELPKPEIENQSFWFETVFGHFSLCWKNWISVYLYRSALGKTVRRLFKYFIYKYLKYSISLKKDPRKFYSIIRYNLNIMIIEYMSNY